MRTRGRSALPVCPAGRPGRSAAAGTVRLLVEGDDESVVVVHAMVRRS
ncbi:hypothetical protein HMPREF9057_02809 [Actinomyces sp. oral taxon 171 str. F0337]|nr:hypothetical protein HMPREF9057_02809 [Actinomyces sp. oral taxon 171 str. F0337]